MQHVRLQREQVEAAIRHSNNSSPGPDGIPYAAWRRLGDEAVDILFDAAVEMTEEDGFTLLGKVYSDLNASLLFFCLRQIGTTVDGLDIYEPGGVRPLNVTNTDNRLLASATRLAIEPTLGALITEDQRGFIGGRSMLANLVDIDEATVTYSLGSSDVIALFYDFAAAFPSVEHRLLHDYFAALGWPDWLRRMVLNLYHNNFCHISMGDSVFVGFGITRGIRQGCPLSPLLFAAVSELL